MNDEHRGSPATVSKSVIYSKKGAEITDWAPSRSDRAVDEEMIKVGYHDERITHQVFSLLVDGWLLCSVAHPL